ncbi:MAG: hypothetical protein J5770_00700 [Bacteroidaceae bacterium]|nr:hypothetical protein [Bacteroidaceae bacterium]
MKDQELHDILHAYRPQIDDNEAFMDKLMVQMDAEDDKQQQARIIPLYRRILPWMAGVAASVLLVLTLYTQHSEQPSLKAQYISQTDKMSAWQYDDEPIGLDGYFAHQKEIQEKGERLAAYIQQQITINIE